MKLSSKHLRSSVAALLLSCVLFTAVGCTSDNKSTDEISEEDISGEIHRKEVFALVSSAENSDTDYSLQYGYIEDIGDVRGYTGGSSASPQAQATCRTWWNYLAAFLDARVAVMQPEEAHADLSRVDTQRKFLNGKNFTLELPLEWTMYGDEFYIDKEQLDGIAD